MFARITRPGQRAFLVLVSTLLLLGGQASAIDSGECLECHDEVTHEVPLHKEQTCLDCHSNIQQADHLPSNLDKLSADGICLQCHQEFKISHSVHSGEGCEGCHGGKHDLILSSDDDCGDCHRRIGREVSRSSHGGEAVCSDCHKEPHGILPADDMESAHSKLGQIKSCGECHDQPPELMKGFLSGVHAQGLLASGLEAAASCSDCHGGHYILPRDNDRSTVSHEKLPETCGACHSLLLDKWVKSSSHGVLWQEGGKDGPDCMHCHSSHEIVETESAGQWHRFPEDCGGCHEKQYKTFRHSFHGKASQLGMRASAICSDCHTPHANLPPDDPRSSVHKSNLVETCGRCHDDANESFVSFDPHNDPSDPEDNVIVYWTWLFMVVLLVGVFAFFGLHDILWLQRAVVGAIRGEFKRRYRDDGPYVRRFSRVHIGTHIVVILSFLLLAATGLPLRFYDTAWAPWLVNLFGGLETSRYLHRFAALVTFGYFLFHLGHIFRKAFVQKQKGLFWGPDSMVPQPQDAVDIWNNLKYFLYLGPRPKLDRWTYWEKFDYMAVFWGVAIIGLSGLMVWFPEFFSRFLPGWTLNVAYIVHSEEALLATGFIFIFHFFHTHLRPETFPMDPVVFLGGVPLERFKEERPIEYQRLVEAGTLDDYLIDPPTPAQRRRAYIFGFSAVAIGVTLAIGIFWGIFHHGLG